MVIIDNIKLVAGWMCHRSPIRTQYGGVRLMCCGGKAKIVIAISMTGALLVLREPYILVSGAAPAVGGGFGF